MAKIVATTPLDDYVVDMDGTDGEGMVRVLSMRRKRLSAPLALQTLAQQTDLSGYEGPQDVLLPMLAQVTLDGGKEEQG